MGSLLILLKMLQFIAKFLLLRQHRTVLNFPTEHLGLLC